MTEKPLYAPGCFGEAATYRDDEICRACSYNAACALAHARVLKQLREFHGFDVKEPTRQVGSLPVKVKKIFDELGKSAEEVRSEMQAGVNPYSIQASFVGIACHILLTCRETTRETLASVLRKYRGYNDATADVYARHSIQILKHCGVVSVDGEKINLTFG